MLRCPHWLKSLADRLSAALEVMINMAPDSQETDDDQRPQPSHPSAAASKVGITVSVLVLGVLGVLADTAQVVDLFRHSWVIIVLVLGICIGIVGALILERQWRKPPGALVLVAVALLVVASAAVTTAVVYSAQPADAAGNFTGTPGPSPSTSSVTTPTSQEPSQTAPRQLEISDPKANVRVSWKDEVTVTGTSVGPDRHVALFLKPLSGPFIWPSLCNYDAANKRVICHVQYGEREQSRGSSFDVWAVTVDEKDYYLLSDYYGKGKWFDPNKSPVRVIVESERVRVKRED